MMTPTTGPTDPGRRLAGRQALALASAASVLLVAGCSPPEARPAVPAPVAATPAAPAPAHPPAPAPAPAPAAPDAQAQAQAPAQAQAQAGLPESTPLPRDENGKPMLFNDPPAAPDTPLCGREARERNAIGIQIQGDRVAASGICATFACYDPLTATYLGADGYTHVCR